MVQMMSLRMLRIWMKILTVSAKLTVVKQNSVLDMTTMGELHWCLFTNRC